MKKLKKLLFGLLRYSGLPLFFRNFIQKNRISILVFHDISSETAEIAFDYLSKRYHIIDLNDYLDAVREKTQLPPKSLIITFDDGYIGNYEMLQVAKEKKIPVTVFLCAGLMNTNRHYWTKFRHQNIETEKLKKISNTERLATLKSYGFDQEKSFDTPQAMQKDHLDKMKESANFQSHTVFHPCLPKCTDGEAQFELAEAKNILESEFGLTINAIAYPNGDYSNRDIDIAKRSGYSCGLTVDYGFNTLHTDLFRLKRLATGDTNNLNELSVKSSGVWGLIKTRNGKKQNFGFTSETE